jgi:signal transduction histidine kinase
MSVDAASVQIAIMAAVYAPDVVEKERADRALVYLAKAGEILSFSLDHDRTLDALARVVVPEIADWCLVSVFESSRIRVAAFAHRDMTRADELRALAARYPSDPDGPTRTALVIRTGEADFIGTVTDGFIDGTFDDPECRRLARSLGCAAVLTVPLRVGTTTLGAISMVMMEGRCFSPHEAALAEELGNRAGVALQNARLYRDAVIARRAAEDANAAKVEFLARMSHELRTPLNAIAGFADLLAMGLRGPLMPQQAEDVRRIQRNQLHLQALISDILNFAKLEVGRLEFDIRPTPVRAAIAAIEQVYSKQFEATGVTWTSQLDGPFWVHADVDKFQQILTNLVGNAMKFTPPGGRVGVRARVRTDMVEIILTDSGSGIPPEKLSAIFDPFVQLERPGEVPVGTGLGLAIARDLARGMGGDLWAEPVEKGAAFVLRLRKATPPGHHRRTE